ncbi:MAG TPA: AAA family ATPase [Victivallales bacterium]|nr:AAA family ATPase [Victivallales bacterium]
MKLIELSITNYRSIKQINNFKVTSFQSLIGENNTGKSNILAAIEVFLSAGAGGTKPEDFNDKAQTIIIKSKFKVNTPHLRKIWKPYLLNDELILEKHLWIEIDTKTEKESIKNIFHGYQAEPKEWYLSEKKIKEQKGERPKWKEIVDENRLPDYFLENGNCNVTIYRKALTRFLNENEIEYDAPDLSSEPATKVVFRILCK